jgi:thiamine monophosphate kinase
LEAALHDGEDFELLFTLSPAEYEKLSQLTITKIGTVTYSGRMELKTPNGQIKLLTAKGYDHL